MTINLKKLMLGVACISLLGIVPGCRRNNDRRSDDRRSDNRSSNKRKQSQKSYSKKNNGSSSKKRMMESDSEAI